MQVFKPKNLTFPNPHGQGTSVQNAELYVRDTVGRFSLCQLYVPAQSDQCRAVDTHTIFFTYIGLVDGVHVTISSLISQTRKNRLLL